MTPLDPRYETDRVASLLPEGLSKELRGRYCKSWNRWLAWCQEHEVHPGEADRPAVARFVAQLPAESREYTQTDVSTIYFKLGGANPARRLRTLTDDGARIHRRRWNAWAAWCELRSATPLPADADQLAAYLGEVAKKKSPRYAEKSLATVSRIHVENNLPDPQRAATAVTEKIANIKASIDQSPRRLARVQYRQPTPEEDNRATGSGGRSGAPLEVVIRCQPSPRTSLPSWPRSAAPAHTTTSAFCITLSKTPTGTNGAKQNPVDSDLVRDALRALKPDLGPPAQAEDREAPSNNDYGFPDDGALQHLAASSRYSYRSYWRTWFIWCVNQGIDPLDATPRQLSVFLGEEAERLAMKSVELYVAAIGCVYEVAAPERGNPARDVLVSRKMKALKILYRKPPSQVAALTAEGFARIQATARRPKPWETERQALVRGTTDLAIIGLMRDAMLRVSEAVAVTWADLEEAEDGSGRLYIAHSKTDQEGEGAVLFVSPQTMEWLKRMREMVMERSTIFGINRNSMYLRVKEAAQYAGLEGRYGSHSMRIGMAQDLARANTSLPLLMQAGRWKRADGPVQYIRKIQAGHNAVAQWYNEHPGRALVEQG